MNTTLSIIIVAYKAEAYLYKCISSIIRAKPKVSHEIIVIDNNEDTSIEKDLKKKFPAVIYVKSLKNIGYGGGNNLGAHRAKGKYLFFLNPDTLVQKKTIDILVAFLINTKQAGAVAPLLLHANLKPFKKQGSGLLTPLIGIFALSFLNKYFSHFSFLQDFWLTKWNKTETKKVDVVPGTAFVIEKKLFEEVGAFDETFFLFFEEYDLAQRIKLKEYSNYIIPKAKIIHYWGMSTKHNSQTKKIFIKSRFIYFKKYYGIIWAIVIHIVTSISRKSVIVIISIFLLLYYCIVILLQS